MKRCIYIEGHCDKRCDLYNFPSIAGTEALTQWYIDNICHNDGFLPGKNDERCQTHENLTALTFETTRNARHRKSN